MYIGPSDQRIQFANGTFAKIQYKYDPAKLKANNLPEEFNVMYFEGGTWKPVDRVTVDPSTRTITAYTSHLTPFVPVVVLPTAGFTTPPPSCIAADFVSGIGGSTSGSAELMIIDENFKYYKDRAYTVVPFSSSPENASTFASLGFSGAMGIATCNGGGTNGCGSQNQNKLYTGTNYINFTAQMDLDVYLMYETRGGGSGKNLNTSNDAPWLAAKGFTNTGYFVETTDSAQYYRVYKKTINQGQNLLLDGNLNGVTDPNIQTNYWLVLKRKGITVPEPATVYCVAQPSQNTPIVNVKISGAAFPSNGTYDFGSVVAGSSSATIPFSIENKGGQSLNLLGTPVVSLSGANASQFTLTQPSFPVPANGSANFTVKFTPSSIGTKTATLTILSDDPSQGIYTINLTGTTPSPPSNLVYPANGSLGFAKGVAKTVTPTVIGTVTSCVANPSLPSGFNIHLTTCAISGIATATQVPTPYTITASNALGSTTASVSIVLFERSTYQTGQTQCYDASGNVIPCAGTGQDGEYKSGLPAAVYSGPNQHPTYTDDYTTTDTTSGLVWKTCIQGIEGADCGTDPQITWYNLIPSCQSLNNVNSGNGYAGRNDWRAASFIEIYKWKLVRYFKTENELSFPGIQKPNVITFDYYISFNLELGSECYHTALNSLAVGRDPGSFAGRYCSEGSNGNTFNPKGLNRCVSGTVQEKAPQFSDLNNGINLDIATGLSWTKCRLGLSGTNCQTGTPNQMNFHDAINACKNLNLGGKTWKVPNVLEALSLFNRVNYGFDYQLFPFDSTYTEDFWTSTPLQNGVKALFVPQYGTVQEETTSNLHGVRCISVVH